MKKIAIKTSVKKFGHEPFDYKKDGSFRKGREKEHDYYTEVMITYPCDEVVIDNTIIGYKKKNDDPDTLFNDNGKPVRFAHCTSYGYYKHSFGREVFKRNGKWFIQENNKYISLWIEDENENPLYIIKEYYDTAKRKWVDWNLAEEGLLFAGLWGSYYFREHDKFKQRQGELEEEFDRRYKNKTIDITEDSYYQRW